MENFLLYHVGRYSGLRKSQIVSNSFIILQVRLLEYISLLLYSYFYLRIFGFINITVPNLTCLAVNTFTRTLCIMLIETGV